MDILGITRYDGLLLLDCCWQQHFRDSQRHIFYLNQSPILRRIFLFHESLKGVKN